MVYPVNFGGLAAGNQPLSDFDTMFAVAGQQGNIPCTATGTDAITLTPGTNYYVPSSYTDAQIVSFKAVNNSTGAVTIQVGGLGLVKLYTAAGVQANSGDILLGSHYECQYWGDLDTGTGAFQILNATVTAVASPVQASYSNLSIANNAGTPNTKVDLAVNSVIMQNASGGTVRSLSVSVTINFAANGANGLDTGSIAANTFYFIYAIFNANSSTVAGVASLSSSAPSPLPSGYTYYARLGAVRTATGSANLMGTKQIGNTVTYTVGVAQTTTTAGGAPVIAAATAGTFSVTSPALVTASVSAYVPSTAAGIHIALTGFYKGNTASTVLCAPNASWSGTQNGPQGSNGLVWPLAIVATGTQMPSFSDWMTLESTNVYWASSNAGGAIACLGWKDNL